MAFAIESDFRNIEILLPTEVDLSFNRHTMYGTMLSECRKISLTRFYCDNVIIYGDI